MQATSDTQLIRIVVQETREDSSRRRTVIDTTKTFTSLAAALKWMTATVELSTPATLEAVSKITLTVEG